MVKRIITDSEIWNQMSSDHSVSRETYEPPLDQAVYILALQNEEPTGVFVLVPKSHIRYEIHTCLSRKLRGSRALCAAAMLVDWVWANTPCERLFTEVPVTNAPALWFAKAARMKESGREPACFLKGGVLVDVIILGMNRPRR